MADVDLEPRIQFLGHQIFAALRRGRRLFQPMQWIDHAMMRLAMSDESLKSQLFRFVDVLPAMRGSADLARHFHEYMRNAGGALDPAIQSFAEAIPAPWIAAAAQFNVRRLARKFIAAGDLPEAVTAVARLRSANLAFTLDLLGEAVISEKEAEEYQTQYLSLVEALPARLAELPGNDLLDRDSQGPIPRANFSIKLSSLYSQFDPIDPARTESAVLERLRPILRAARRLGAFVNFDMEQFAFKNLTTRIFKTVFSESEFRDWRDIGIAIQAYLRGALEDLEGLRDWSRQRGTPVWIRLVKGAYWDYEIVQAAQNDWPIPVFTDKSETDRNFESASAFLIENHADLRPAIASHNLRSIASALAHAERARLAPGDMEFQMLFGMADELKAALASLGHRVRVYTPAGRLLPGMAYLVRRLLENTSNESFLRAESFEHESEERLLMNPQTVSRPRVSGPAPAFVNEPPTDFSREPARAAMESALRKPAGDQPNRCEAMIGGRRVSTDFWIEARNPSHKSRVVGRSARATPSLADQALAAATKAFADWRDTPAFNRAALLDRVARFLQRDRFKIAATEIAECGKPWREADADVAEAIDFCRYYAWQMRLLSSPGGADLPGERNQWIYEPRGVAVVIAPWNFPLAILTGMTAAAVVTGNPAIMKPAEQSSLVAAHLAEAFVEAGAPAGVVNYLPGVGEEIGPVLTTDPRVALIAFTGSRAVGLGINQEAAALRPGQDHIKRVIVELGGKNAIIVDEDADLDEAVSGVVASAFGYSGQKCSACSRAIVLAGVYDTFIARLIEATRSLKITPAEDPACRVGPVIDAEALSRIHAAIDEGKKSARLAYAGDVGNLADEGYYVGPHIFTDVPPTSALATDEIFGPVLSMMRAADLGEALALASGVKYALTGGIYSRSPANIDHCRREFRVGNLYINRKITGALVGRQPFGGFKLSGAGTQAGGPDYLKHFMIPRCITENTLRHGFAPRDAENA